MFEDLARNLVVPHQLGMTTVLVVPDGAKEVVREDWELEGRDAAHVDHVTDDLTGFLQGLSERRTDVSPIAARTYAGTHEPWQSLDISCPKSRQKPPQSCISTCPLPKEIPMSLSALESTINAAFDARDGISTATKGEVRDAVEHALDLLDKGEARVAEREASGKWKVNQWLKKAVLLSFRLNDMSRDFRRPRQGRRGGTRCRRSSTAGARTVFATPAFAPCRARSCAARPSSPGTSC